jgi:phenylalanyl-tRNA synthetase beta chain
VKINHHWLRAWVDTDLDAAAIAERFTLAGLEVDDCVPVAPLLEGVVVGEIVAIEPHPDADRLRVCRVRGDSCERTIVCGAPNARLGLKAPLATLGTVLPGGLKIKPAKLRGVASEGMLCSEPELGLGEEASGLMELPDDAPVGESLTRYLGLDDHVLDIDLTPNRADCLSVRGLARELAALTGAAVSAPDIEPVEAQIDDRVAIDLESPADCPRYLGRIIRGVDATAPTPLWMAEALRRCGLRSLGPVVDVTNYVLLELGQPMHAFDLAKLQGGIRVRRARSGERMVLLDGRDVELDFDMLMICDAQRPLAIGGVIGAEDSGVTDGTRDILLESAWFNPASIVGRARRLGLATESAHRFERGVDPTLQRQAMERASALILAIAGGLPGPIVEQCDDQQLPVPVSVKLRPERVNQLLGSKLDRTEMVTILERLGMQVRDQSDGLEVTPQPARRDIALEVDLIEEIARVHGYDRLPTRRPRGRLRLITQSESTLSERKLRHQLGARGFQEIMTWSFVAEQELRRLGLGQGAQPLANPLSRELAVLRTSLLPGLLKTAVSNARRRQQDFRLFEVGTCFGRHEGGFQESLRLGLLMTGRLRGEHAGGPGAKLDFFDIKGEVEHLLALNQTAGSVQITLSRQPWLHPGQGADLMIDKNPAGSFGQLHPECLEAFDLPEPVFVAELEFAAISRLSLPLHRAGSRYPATRRDLALVVAESVPAAELTDAIREIGGKRVEKCIIFDEYRGVGVENGCKSLAIGLIIRDLSRTLTDHDVDALIEAVIGGVGKRFGAKLRG